MARGLYLVNFSRKYNIIGKTKSQCHFLVRQRKKLKKCGGFAHINGSKRSILETSARMDFLGVTSTTNIFISAAQQQSQLESLANSALSRGIDLYTKQDYDGAIKEFQRSIGLSPSSSYSPDASHYMANAYLRLDDPENAIKAYQTSIRLHPDRDDTHINLGNLYFAQKRYGEAASEYSEAVRINPDANNLFSLGQAYLNTGEYDKAERRFDRVRSLEPGKPNGHYGLGLVLSRKGRYEDAIRQFEEAITIKNDFHDAYAEIGYAYADLGQMDDAEEIVALLEDKAPDLADTLSVYMYEVDPPKLTFAYYSSTFNHSLSANTPVSALDAYLTTANTTRTFTMKFRFSKEMDRTSVENQFNWTISRALGGGPGQAYNFNMAIPDTEIKLAPIPDYVTYDSETLTATVYFRVQQNAVADGTIDPSHIEFKFNGKDQYGLKMDSEMDQFTGFSGIA